MVEILHRAYMCACRRVSECELHSEGGKSVTDGTVRVLGVVIPREKEKLLQRKIAVGGWWMRHHGDSQAF